MSFDEVRCYLGDNRKRFLPATHYTKARSRFLPETGCWWWRRTNGDSAEFAQFIRIMARSEAGASKLPLPMAGVRPAIWVDASVLGQ